LKYRLFELYKLIICKQDALNRGITLIILSAAMLALSCGVAPRMAANGGAGSTDRPSAGTGQAPPTLSAVSSSDSDRVRAVKLAYNDWKGIPYMLGGSSYDGIDCSALMQIVYEDYFGLEVPRLTSDQMRTGKKVKRNNIRTGDMVFFKTGRKTLHVGIVVEGDRFLHASTSNGVMISSLSENYWSSRYIEARRVL
jgi:cell wall-associated NlpC family hydrolase